MIKETTRQKMRLAKLGKAGYWKNKKRPEIQKWLGIYTFKKGQKNPHKGDKNWINSGTFKFGHVGMKGKDNPAWKNGLRAKKNEWKNKIFERDNYTCLLCFERGKSLNAHHVREWALFPELRYSLDNGVTLCRTCHQNLHKRS